MFHRVMPTGFEDIVEANDVALNIDIGVVDAVAYTGLGCEVDHDIEFILGKEVINQGLVDYAAFDERPRIARIGRIDLLQLLEAVFFQRDIVVGVHVVDTHDGGTTQLFEESLDEVGSDEAGCACD